MAGRHVDGRRMAVGARRALGLGLVVACSLVGRLVVGGLALGGGLVGCAGAQGGDGDAAGRGAGVDASVSERVAGEQVGGEKVFVPGPWARLYAVRDADSQRVQTQELRTASDVGADGRWQVRFERARVGSNDWTLERTLTMMRTSDGVAMVRLEDVTRDMVYEFEPALVLAPGVVVARSEARAKTTQGDDVGEAIATIVPLGAEDGMPRVRTTLTLVQGRTRVERSSELTLGANGSVRERNERSVRWGPIRVDHADEVLEEVGE